jgi:hypothetical protein
MRTAFPDNDFGDEVKDSNNQALENWFLEYLNPNLKVAKYCVNKAGCWNDGTKTLSGSAFSCDSGAIGIGKNIIIFNLSNGINVDIDVWDSSNSISYFGIVTDYKIISFWVDINGRKNPNVIGKDVFAFVFTKERGLLPAGHDMTDQRIATNCSKSGTGAFCTERIIRNGWEIDNSYPW